MGVTSNPGDVGLPAAAGRSNPRPAGSAGTPALALAASLATLLGSEDTLFRDPFADFAPSGR